MTISRWIFLITRNVSNKIYRENQNTYFIFNNFFRKLRRLWDNVEKCGGARGATDDVTIWRMRVECWMCKATCTRQRARADAHAFARAQTQICNIYCFSTATVIRERASMLRYTYISCFVIPSYYPDDEDSTSEHAAKVIDKLFYHQ
jgi:hypothetical protein